MALIYASVRQRRVVRARAPLDPVTQCSQAKAEQVDVGVMHASLLTWGSLNGQIGRKTVLDIAISSNLCTFVPMSSGLMQALKASVGGWYLGAVKSC